MSAYNNSAGNLPTLRQDCDTNLQFAFQEARWPLVITHAKQQAKRTHDPYFEAIELAARSQLDTTADQRAAFVSVEKILAEGKPVKDHWTIELYDWACTGIDKDYAKTIGTLRAGFVKECWKPDVDKSAPAIRSFFACVANDDWENAQKIAALVDQKFPRDPRHQFYNILSYFMLSSRLSANDPKKALFRTLAIRLVEKARDLRDSTPKSADFPSRAITTEEEMLLWLDIQVSSVKDDLELGNLLKKPEFDALARLSEGYVSVFKEIMSLLERLGHWESLFDIAQKLFDRALLYLVDTQNTDTSKTVPMEEVLPKEDEIHQRMQDILNFTSSRVEELGEFKKEAEAQAFQSAVMDWSLWKQFINAASHLECDKKALKQLRSFMEKVAKLQTVFPLYRKQMEIASLSILFHRYSSSEPTVDTTGASSNTRVDSLMRYIVSNFKLVSCFDDLKPYLEQLSFDEIKSLLSRLGEEGEMDSNDVFQNIVMLTLRVRFRYLFTTSPHSVDLITKTRPTCKFCTALVKSGSCKKCLTSLAKSCAWIYNRDFNEHHLRVRIDNEDVDPFADLVIIGATCLLKLAGLNLGRRNKGISATHSIDLKFVIQAIAWLTSHYSRVAQKNAAIPVFLTKLYLLIGCVPQAKILWDTLGVKNVTLDSLGPLFSDRLASISPGMWKAGSSTPMNQYHRYYKDAIRRTIPANIKTALEQANYPSVLGLLATQDRLSHSCTMIMANVEDRRGLRAVGSKSPFDTRDDPLLRLIKPSRKLVVVTDHAALPNHEYAPTTHSSNTLVHVVSIGPGLSEERAKLSLYAERFLSLMMHKDPKDYKPVKVAQTAELERSYVSETLKTIDQHLQALRVRCLETFNRQDSDLLLTSAEAAHYDTVNHLVSYVIQATKGPWTKSTAQSPIATGFVAQISAQLQEQIADLQAERKHIPENMAALGQFTSLHALGMLRESIFAVRLTLNYLERTTSQCKNDVPRWLPDDIKSLNTAATEATTFVKKQIKSLNDAANASGWLDRIAEFAFGGLASDAVELGQAAEDAESGDLATMVFVASGGKAGLEHTIGEIKDSWQEVAKGWNAVKFD